MNMFLFGFNPPDLMQNSSERYNPMTFNESEGVLVGRLLRGECGSAVTIGYPFWPLFPSPSVSDPNSMSRNNEPGVGGKNHEI